MKKYLSTVLAVMMLAVLGNVFGSCGSSKDDADDPNVPDANPQLNWIFTYDISQTEDGVVIKWKAEEKTKSISEKGETRIFCKHERDGYAGPREVSLEYSQNHTTYGKLKTVKTSISAERVAYIDSATTTAMVEDGNVIYCYYSQERVVLKVQDREYELPYIKVDKTLLEKLNLLPGTAKTREDGQVIVDSVCREPIWKAQCAVVNYKDAKTFDVQMSDLFKVYQLEESEIKSGKIVGDNRVVLDDNTERCDVIIDWTKNDNTVHQGTVSKILNRRIITYKREFYVSEYGFTWKSDKELEVGYVIKNDADGDWTVYERTDRFGAFIANANDKDDPIETRYELYHEKAVYKSEKFGVSHTFDFADFNPKEKSTVEGETQPYNYRLVYRPLDNTISTSYLGYTQDASETILLYKEDEGEDVLYYDDWDDVASYVKFEDDRTIWYTEYLYWKGDKEERTAFEWIQNRSLEYLGPWVSVEENNNYETSAIVVELVSSEPVEQEQKGAVAKWNKFGFDIHSVVTLNGSKQYDKWHSTEGGDFTVTYRGKTLTIKGYGYKVNNEVAFADNLYNGDYHEWGYTNVLSYEWGDNIKTSTATGTIKVAEPIESDKFFPREWGDLLEVKQTLTNSMSHEGYNYVWSLRFTKGVLPVILNSGDTTPNFGFELFEYTSVKDYNSATYTGGTWINTTAKDTPAEMSWERDGMQYDKKAYREAGGQNWDEGHKRDGHASVFTSRYKLDVEDGYMTATDTYTGKYMGGWK